MAVLLGSGDLVGNFPNGGSGGFELQERLWIGAVFGESKGLQLAFGGAKIVLFCVKVFLMRCKIPGECCESLLILVAEVFQGVWVFLDALLIVRFLLVPGEDLHHFVEDRNEFAGKDRALFFAFQFGK